MVRRSSASELAPAELAAWRGFIRVHSAVVRALDAELVTMHDLPLSTFEVLLFLARSPNGRLRMSDIADSVLLTRSGVSRLVDRLEAEGLVERVTCASDHRGLFAAITERGRERLREARPTHLEGVRKRFLEHFSADELEQLSAFWNRVLPGSAE